MGNMHSGHLTARRAVTQPRLGAGSVPCVMLLQCGAIIGRRNLGEAFGDPISGCCGAANRRRVMVDPRHCEVAHSVNRRRILTPHRHPKLTPRSCSVLSLVPVVHRSSARAAKCPSRRLTQRRACWACGPTGARGCDRSDNQERCLSRQLSFPVSRISQWWVSRSSNAVAILASPKTVGHSAKARLVVITTDVRS